LGPGDAASISVAVNFRFCAGLLPRAIVADGDADPAIGDLRHDRSLASFEQSLAGPDRKAVDLGPLRDRHHTLVVKRAGERIWIWLVVERRHRAPPVSWRCRD